MSDVRSAPSRLCLRLLTLALALFGAAGCNSSGRPPRCPEQGARWIELTTEHFTVLTDAPDDRARWVALDFETAYEELRAVAFPRVEGGARLTVVAFQNDWDRWVFRKGATAAEYVHQAGGEVERSPLIVTTAPRYLTEKWRAREVFLHELTHRFVAQTYGGLPVWLNEGLAQYLETLEVQDGKATIGDTPFGYELTRGYVVSVGELLSVDTQTFYGQLQTTVAGEDARLRYYRGAWAFVHFLHDGPAPIPARFQAFIQKLGRGEVLRDAWRETLGQVPKAEIERLFYDYVNGGAWTKVERPIQLRAPAPVTRLRPMRDEEVHLLWASLADDTRLPSDPRSVDVQLDAAERAAPGSAEVSYQRGARALRKRREEEAAQYFEAALAKAPDEPRYLFGALAAYSEEERWHDLLSQERGKALRARLVATARTADELGMAARILADDAKDEEALRDANAAIAADPTYWGGYATRAFVHFRAARYGEAVADQERAVTIASEGGGGVDDLTHVLGTYREMLAKERRVGADGGT